MTHLAVCATFNWTLFVCLKVSITAKHNGVVTFIKNKKKRRCNNKAGDMSLEGDEWYQSAQRTVDSCSSSEVSIQWVVKACSSTAPP